MLATVLALALQTAAAPQVPTGTWRAWLDSPGGELPFELHLTHVPPRWQAFLGGSHAVSSIVVEGRELRLRFDPYDSEIVACLDPDDQRRLDGTWTLVRGGGQVTRMPFHATLFEGENAALHRWWLSEAEAAAPLPDLSGTWSVRFSASPDLAVAQLHHDPDWGAWGTILTTLGDYGGLVGDARGALRLSGFDGAHAFLFVARLQDDGSLAGDFWSRDTWHETWTAVRDPDAALPDAFGLTSWNESVRLADLAYPDVHGRLRKLDDPEFRGAARIVAVFGTWCPNCNDEAPLLAELDHRYRQRRLRVLGLAFEHSEEHRVAAERVRSYTERHRIEFPILIAGTSDKQAASEAFPLLDRVRAFPTTLFLDAEGKVRAVHTGFSGPATGEEHRRLRDEFERLVEQLLAEAERAEDR